MTCPKTTWSHESKKVTHECGAPSDGQTQMGVFDYYAKVPQIITQFI